MIDPKAKRITVRAVALALVATAALTGCADPRPDAPTNSPVVSTSQAVGVAPAISSDPPGAPDPLRVNQWALDAARLPAAWEHSTGSGQVIAVVDTGVDPTHPDLAGKLVGGYDLLTGSTGATDPHGHGTHVAGIAAAAANNGIGIIGAAPEAKVMPVRVLDANGAGSDDTIAAGIDWATEHGANVINLSLGESGLAGRLSKGGPINAAIRRAGAAGIVVVAAAGNDSDRRRVYRIGVPVMVVVASDQNGQPTGFTNTGDLRSIAAPGQDILSTAPIGPTTGWPQGTDGYGTLSGTSMASPLVAGVAALLLAQGRSAEQVITVLADTATNPSADRRLGAGIVDAAAAVTA